MSYGDDYNSITEAVNEVTLPNGFMSAVKLDVEVMMVTAAFMISFGVMLPPVVQKHVVDELGGIYDVEDHEWRGKNLWVELEIPVRSSALNVADDVEKDVVDIIDKLRVE